MVRPMGQAGMLSTGMIITFAMHGLTAPVMSRIIPPKRLDGDARMMCGRGWLLATATVSGYM